MIHSARVNAQAIGQWKLFVDSDSIYSVLLPGIVTEQVKFDSSDVGLVRNAIATTRTRSDPDDTNDYKLGIFVAHTPGGLPTRICPDSAQYIKALLDSVLPEMWSQGFTMDTSFFVSDGRNPYLRTYARVPGRAFFRLQMYIHDGKIFSLLEGSRSDSLLMHADPRFFNSFRIFPGIKMRDLTALDSSFSLRAPGTEEWMQTVETSGADKIAVLNYGHQTTTEGCTRLNFVATYLDISKKRIISEKPKQLLETEAAKERKHYQAINPDWVYGPATFGAIPGGLRSSFDVTSSVDPTFFAHIERSLVGRRQIYLSMSGKGTKDAEVDKLGREFFGSLHFRPLTK